MTRNAAANSAALGSDGVCLQRMLGDGTCDPACNIVSCQHDGNDCPLQHSIWTTRLQSTPVSMSEAPPSLSQLTPLTVHLEMDSVTILIDEDSGSTHAQLPLIVRMTWQDPRVLDESLNPARDVWAMRLSASRAQAQQPATLAEIQDNMALFYLPSVAVVPAFRDTVRQQWSIAVNPSARNYTAEDARRLNQRAFANVNDWEAIYRNGSALSYDVTLQADTRQRFDYIWYPFDKHTIRSNISNPGFNMTTCGHDALWGLGGLPTALVHEASGWLASGLTTEPSLGGQECTISFKLRRNPIMFLTQRLMPQFLIVQTGMLAMYLNPKMPPLVGGRVGLLVTTMLLVSNRLSDSTPVDDAQNTPGWIQYVSRMQISFLVGKLQDAAPT